jgi:succinyldiaminopimelate transaminase
MDPGYREVMRTNPVLTSLGEYPIARLQDLARRMVAEGRRLVDFSIGDPREPTPSFIPEALRRAVPAVSQYPTTRGLPQLRRAVAGYVHRRFGVEVDPDTQVIPTSGSKEAIFSAPLAFVDRARGDLVIWPTPGYPIYERGARLAGAVGHPVRLGSDFILHRADVPDSVWERAAMLWICTPHNPAGSVTPRSDLAELYEQARDRDVLICSDECYSDLFDLDPPGSILQVAGAGTRGALCFLSLSKRSGMTGYRSGAVVGDAEAVALLASLRSSTGTASPEFTQAAAIAAWSDDEHAALRREVFREKRLVLRKAFEDLGYRVAASEAGLYLWVEVGDDLAITERLLEAGVVVSPGRVFGAGGEGYLRLALVPTLEECREAVEVLAACLLHP